MSFPQSSISLALSVSYQLSGSWSNFLTVAGFLLASQDTDATELSLEEVSFQERGLEYFWSVRLHETFSMETLDLPDPFSIDLVSLALSILLLDLEKPRALLGGMAWL